MPESYYPSNLRETQLAARHALTLAANPNLTELLGQIVALGLIPRAEAHLSARANHRSAQAALKQAHETTVAANIAADNALKMLDATAKFNRGAETAALLRTLRDGKALGEITGLPNAEQPDVVDDYLQRMSEYVASGRIPRAHVEEVRSTNDALRAAVSNESAMSRARNETKATFDAAKQAFLNYQRLLVLGAEVELGEEGARALLLSFSRSANEPAGEDEEVGDDPTVDEGAPVV